MVNVLHAGNNERRPRLAVAYTLCMLVGVSVLSTLLGSSRRSFNLTTRFHPDGWQISFRPPASWPSVETTDGQTLAYRGPDIDGGHRIALVRRRNVATHLSAEAAAANCLMDWGSYSPLAKVFHPPTLITEPVPFGSISGARAFDSTAPVAVCASVIDDEAYCIGMTSTGTFHEGDLEVLNQIVASVQIADNH